MSFMSSRAILGADSLTVGGAGDRDYPFPAQRVRFVWNDQKVPWNADDFVHVRNAIQTAGIDADTLIADVKAKPNKHDRMALENQDQ